MRPDNLARYRPAGFADMTIAAAAGALTAEWRHPEYRRRAPAAAAPDSAAHYRPGVSPDRSAAAAGMPVADRPAAVADNSGRRADRADRPPPGHHPAPRSCRAVRSTSARRARHSIAAVAYSAAAVRSASRS